MIGRQQLMTDGKAAISAGLIAISVNTILLKVAAPLGIRAESGGLLRLCVLRAREPLGRTQIPARWESMGLPGPRSLPFWLAFHYGTGFVMVGLYVRVVRSRLPGSGLVKGSLFSLGPWLVNGLAVVPRLGQRPFGVSTLRPSGIAYFFWVNWLFGAILGVLYERLRERS